MVSTLDADLRLENLVLGAWPETDAVLLVFDDKVPPLLRFRRQLVGGVEYGHG